jgi:hypothetical protein
VSQLTVPIVLASVAVILVLAVGGWTTTMGTGTGTSWNPPKVTFAAFLNLKIVRLNRPFGERA